MSFVRTVAFRYLSTKRSEAFISILTFISTVALAIGVAVLVVVMSIMNGFEYELKNKLLGANAHISLRPIAGALFRWGEVQKIASETPGVESVSPYTYNQALLQVDKLSSGVLIRGIRDGDAAGAELRTTLVGRGKGAIQLFHGPAGDEPRSQGEGDDSDENALHASLPRIIIGQELADSLSLVEGDVVTVLSPQVQSSPFGLMPRFRRFQVGAIYSSGLVEYESSLAYIDLSVAQQFFRLGEAIYGFDIRTHNLDKAPEVAKVINERLGAELGGLYAEPWTETHKNLWEALKLERSAYFTVLLLLIVMASFSIVSTLVMLVLEKRKDIAVLRTLGATRREVGSIFRISGMTIGVLGTSVGLVLGFLLNVGLQTYGFPLPEKIFPVATLPIRMDPWSFVITGGCALLICFLATLYPVRRAASLRPSELLRYE